MRHFNDENLLELAELYAEEVGTYSSEDELSEAFDSMLDECYPDFDTEDEPALAEAFNNWTDGLCKDGEIHPEQYNSYEYTGKYS